MSTQPTPALQSAPSGSIVPRRIQTICLSDKAKLGETHWQALLSEPGIEFQCPCGLPVEPYFEPRHKCLNVRARRGELEQHAKPDAEGSGCPVVHGDLALEAVKRGNVLYTDSVFLAPGATGTTRSALRGAAASGEFWYGDFGHLMNQGFTYASLQGLADANRLNTGRELPIRNPTADAVAGHIARFLGNSQMSDGASPVDAARRVGSSILWGVCSRRIIERLHAMRYNPKNEVLFLERAWNSEGRITDAPPIKVGYNVAVRVKGKVWEHNRIIPPPYLVFASIDADNRARQLVIVPICELGDDQGLFSKESGAEGEFVSRIREIRPSVGIIKLAVQGDLHVLGGLWRHRLNATGQLPCRPDVIVLGRRGTAIFQLEGSRDPHYRAGVRRTIADLQTFLRDPRILIRTVTLDDLRSGEPRFLGDIAAIA